MTISKTGFWMLLGRQLPLKKPYFYSVFLKNDVQKTLNLFAPAQNIFWGKMLNNKSEVTNLTKNTKQKNTN